MKPLDQISDVPRSVYREKQSNFFFLIFHSKLVLSGTKDFSTRLELSSSYCTVVTQYVCILVHLYLLKSLLH